MSKRFKASISPESRPIKAAGTASLYWSPYWHKWITRKVTAPKKAPSPAQIACRKVFADAIQLIKNQPAEYHAAAYEFTHGTKYLPRDAMLSASFGMLYKVIDQNGVFWAGAKAMYPTIQSMLSSIGAVKGAFIYFDGDVWTLVTPGPAGKVLTMNPTADGFVWTDAAPPTPDIQELLNELDPPENAVLIFKGGEWYALPPGTTSDVLGIADDGSPSWRNASTDAVFGTSKELFNVLSASDFPLIINGGSDASPPTLTDTDYGLVLYSGALSWATNHLKAAGQAPIDPALFTVTYGNYKVAHDIISQQGYAGLCISDGTGWIGLGVEHTSQVCTACSGATFLTHTNDITATIDYRGMLYFQIRRTATAYELYTGGDGRNWQLFKTYALTQIGTPTFVGFATNNRTGNNGKAGGPGNFLTVGYFKQETP